MKTISVFDRLKITHAIESGKYDANAVPDGPTLIDRLRKRETEFSDHDCYMIEVMFGIKLS